MFRGFTSVRRVIFEETARCGGFTLVTNAGNAQGGETIMRRCHRAVDINADHLGDIRCADRRYGLAGLWLEVPVVSACGIGSIS